MNFSLNFYLNFFRELILELVLDTPFHEHSKKIVLQMDTLQAFPEKRSEYFLRSLLFVLKNLKIQIIFTTNVILQNMSIKSRTLQNVIKLRNV